MTVEALSEKLIQLALNKKARIVLAESCTGGLIADALVSIPGSSEVLESAYITYSDASKVMQLRVNPVLIKESMVVSEIVAKDMAIGALKLSSNASIALAITGFAGPKGENVGLVYIAIATKDHIICKQYNFSGTRNEIRVHAVEAALTMMLDEVS